MQVTITKVFRTKLDRDKNPLKTSDGRDYERLSIKTQEHGDRWLSVFGNEYNQNWGEGTVIDIEVTEAQKGDQVYLNFKGLSKLMVLEKRVQALETWKASMSSGGEAGNPAGEPEVGDVPPMI